MCYIAWSDCYEEACPLWVKRSKARPLERLCDEKSGTWVSGSAERPLRIASLSSVREGSVKLIWEIDFPLDKTYPSAA